MFFVLAWQDDSLAEIFQGKYLYVNKSDICYCFREKNGQVITALIPELTFCHEEADLKIIYHPTCLEENSKVIIRTSDTDMLVIALGCLQHIPEFINVLLEVGLFVKNSLRSIDLTKLFNKLGENVCRALPAFHVFTGSDYTAAFSRKGKIRPLKTLEKDKAAQTVFGDMGFSDDTQEEEFKVIEKFTCTLYEKPKFTSVDDVRLELFLKKYQPKMEKEVVISCEKKMECSFLSPCASALQQKTNRTNHIAAKLLSSWASHPSTSNPFNYGWELSNGNYKVKWFKGDIASKSVELITADKSNGVDESKVCFHFL